MARPAPNLGGSSVKIGLVSPYDFASPGGVTDHVRHLARQLRRLHHEVRVFAPSSRADVDFDTAEFYRIGSPIAVPANDSVARITLSFHLADRVAAIIGRERFDLLHFHEPLMPALPMTMLRMSQAANVGTFHAFAKSNMGYYYGRPLRDDRINILFVGRLEKRKGLGYLLRAYESMKPRVPNSRLIVVGDGPLRGSVESYISRHRL